MVKLVFAVMSVLLGTCAAFSRWSLLSSSSVINRSRYFRRLATKNIVFLGTPTIAADSLRILNELCTQSGDYKVIATVTQPPAPSGRGQKLTMSAVHELSKTLGIPVMHPDKPKDLDFLDQLRAMNIDLCVTAAYGNYLPKAFLAIPKHGTVNIHPSLLPKYRGAAPVQRCLLAGDTETGVSVLYTVPKMDAGPIIKQIKIPLNGSEKAGEVLRRSFDIGSRALFSLLPSIFDGSVVKIEQDESQVVLADKIDASEGVVDLDKMTAQDIHNRCRGFSEWPGIHCRFHFTFYEKSGKVREEIRRVKLITTRVLPRDDAVLKRQGISDGQLISYAKVDGKWVLVLVCGDGSVLGVEELLQEHAKRTVMDARSFFNGVQPSKVLDKVEVRWMKTSDVKE